MEREIDYQRNLVLEVLLCIILSHLLPYLTLAAANSPTGRQSEFSIQEELPPGSIVGGVKESQYLATEFGEDVLPHLRFSFRYSTAPYRYFSIDQNTGIIRTSRKIDRELICTAVLSVCSLILDVTIRPVQYFHILKVVITIEDINDNSPSFLQSRLSLEIKENTAPGSLFPLPLAEDPDSGIFSVQDYRLISTSDKFKLIVKRQYDGLLEVRLNLTEYVDRETESLYSMMVVAVDGGSPARSGSVVLDVIVGDANDNNPVFYSVIYEAEVSEGLSPGSMIVRVHAVDLDDGTNGMILYSFAEFTANLYGHQFGINNQLGEIYLNKHLDYERETTVQLTVVASDLGHGSLPAFAKVTIRVLDENDNSPQIALSPLTSSGLVEVMENTNPGVFAAYIVVMDADSGKNGEVECSVDTEIFQLESVYGNEYKLKTSVIFDREEKAEYTIMMTCHDNGNPVRSSTLGINVTILDENDNPPSITKDIYVIELPERNPVEMLLLSLNATDKDSGLNGIIVFQLDNIDESSSSKSLSIDMNTGKVFADVEFDYEKTKEFRYQITIADCGEISLSTSATLILKIIDINDELPVFEKSVYHFFIMENKPNGEVIGMIHAVDGDATPSFSKITYSMPHGNSAIEIDSRTGSLLTTRRIDREEVNVLEFPVMASNDGYPSMKGFVNVTVYIEDENDNAPVIHFPSKENQVIQVSSHVSIGSFVARVSASDRDIGINSQLVYAVSNGNEQEAFIMDQKTGAISIAKSLPKGGDMTYWLVITVKDCGNPELMSAADLIIQVNSSADISNISPFGGEASETLFSEKLMILTGMICSVVLIMCLIFAIVFFVWRHKQKRNKHKWQMELMARMTPSETSLRRHASSMYCGSHMSQRSLENQSTAGRRCREMLNDTTSGTEKDDSDDDSSHVTSQCLKKEGLAEEVTYYPQATTNSNIQTLDTLPRPGSSNSQLNRNRRRKTNQLRSKPGNSRSESRSTSQRHHQSCKSDNEINSMGVRHNRGRVRRGRAGVGTGSGSECSGSYFDSGMDPSEDSDNLNCVSQSS